MEPVRDLDGFRRRVGAVRRGTPAFTSNLYAVAEQVERWCADERLHAIEREGAVLLLQADRDFHHVFHVAEDWRALQSVLETLPAGLYAADLVGRDDPLDADCRAYAAAGFADHAWLRRMVRLQPAGVAGGGEALAASAGDARDVAALLDRLLDRFAEQVPDVDELERAAGEGRLLLVREADAVAGMLMYDLKGQSAQLRFWHVDEHLHGRGVGRRLMEAFLARCAGARRLVLWVIGDNARSIAIYRRYGFAPDGLIDRIMTLRKEQLQ